MTTRKPFSLDVIDIREPCSADWAAMTGDDAKRFCDACEQHVHNVAGMRPREVRALVAGAADGSQRVCVRVTRDAKGRVMTRSTWPPAWNRAGRRAARATIATLASTALFALSVVGVLFAVGCGGEKTRPLENKVAESHPEEANPIDVLMTMGILPMPPEIMGDWALPEMPEPNEPQVETGEVMALPKAE